VGVRARRCVAVGLRHGCGGGGVDLRGGHGVVSGVRAGQPGLPRPSGYCSKPGDMMMDWVPPPAGVRPLSLLRPSAFPLGGVRSDSVMAGAGRVVPHRDSGCPCVRIIDISVTTVEVHTVANASSPRAVRMWQACRTIRRAWDRAARLPSMRFFTCV
jgi:hypothetical protein